MDGVDYPAPFSSSPIVWLGACSCGDAGASRATHDQLQASLVSLCGACPAHPPHPILPDRNGVVMLSPAVWLHSLSTLLVYPSMPHTLDLLMM